MKSVMNHKEFSKRCVLLLGQILILRRKFRPVQLLQLFEASSGSKFASDKAILSK